MLHILCQHYFFFVYFVCLIFPKPSAITSAQPWTVPQTAPTGLRSNGSTYYVSTPQEFLYTMNTTSAKKIVLINNIDLSGKDLVPFQRTSKLEIDGNGYSILGVSISTPKYTNLGYVSGSFAGVIGVLSSTLVVDSVNLYIEMPIQSLQSTCYSGGFVGYASSASSIEFTNCTVNGSIVINKNVSQYNGGFIGYSVGSVTFNSCINYVDISSNESDGYCGGLIGYGSGNISISLCGNFGELDTLADGVGGLVGYYSSSKNITKCFNSANIYTISGSIGGLIGISNKGYSIDSCYNTGDIEGTRSSYLGAICGNISNSSVSVLNSYSIGTLVSNEFNNTVSKTMDLSSNFYIQFSDVIYGISTYNNVDESFPVTDTFNGGGGDGTSVNGQTVTINSTSTSYVAGYDQIFDFAGGGNESINNSFMFANYSSISQNISIPINLQINGENHNLGSIKINNGAISKQTGVNSVRNKLKEESILGYGIETNYIDISDDIFLAPNAIKVYEILRHHGFTRLIYTDKEQGNTENLDAIWIRDKFGNSGANSIACIYFYGLKTEVIGNCVYVAPAFMYFESKTSNYAAPFYGRTYYSEDNYVKVLDLNDCKINAYDKIEYVSSKANIKTKNLGSNFVTESSINDGYPILKDLYWIYN